MHYMLNKFRFVWIGILHQFIFICVSKVSFSHFFAQWFSSTSAGTCYCKSTLKCFVIVHLQAVPARALPMMMMHTAIPIRAGKTSRGMGGGQERDGMGQEEGSDGGEDGQIEPGRGHDQRHCSSWYPISLPGLDMPNLAYMDQCGLAPATQLSSSSCWGL